MIIDSVASTTNTSQPTAKQTFAEIINTLDPDLSTGHPSMKKPVLQEIHQNQNNRVFEKPRHFVMPFTPSDHVKIKSEDDSGKRIFCLIVFIAFIFK